MKTRIEISCTAKDLFTSLFEVKKIIQATDLASIELKIFYDDNRIVDKGHTWLTVTPHSAPNELYQIFELKQKVKELIEKLDTSPTPGR